MSVDFDRPFILLLESTARRSCGQTGNQDAQRSCQRVQCPSGISQRAPRHSKGNLGRFAAIAVYLTFRHVRSDPDNMYSSNPLRATCIVHLTPQCRRAAAGDTGNGGAPLYYSGRLKLVPLFVTYLFHIENMIVTLL
jgi:hypothetical protein